MKKENKQLNLGLSIHCHHSILVEYCYDYQKRVEYIKKNKLQDEQEIRLRLFKILPQKAIKEIPKVWQKAYVEWPQKSKDAFHKKWCGCSNWKNGVINFSGK